MLRVVTNLFKAGFAIPVPLSAEYEEDFEFTKQDKHGLSWTTWGEPPPKHSDERWEKLAKRQARREN